MQRFCSVVIDIEVSSGVCYFQTMKLPLLENLVCNNFKYSDVFDECCKLDVTMDGSR